MDCVTAGGLLKRVDKQLGFERQGSIAEGDHYWTAKPGSSFHVLRNWMRKRAWTVVRAWVWRSGASPGLCCWPLGDRHHAFRQGWRLWQLRRFLRQVGTKLKTYWAGLLKSSSSGKQGKFDFALLRPFLLENAANRSVPLGAFVSPAWLEACENTDPSHHRCPRCGAQPAPFQHMTV